MHVWGEFAESSREPRRQYPGGGLVYRGLIPDHDFAEIGGLGVATAFICETFGRCTQRAGTSVDHTEITLEMSYAIIVRPQIVIQPKDNTLSTPVLTHQWTRPSSLVCDLGCI